MKTLLLPLLTAVTLLVSVAPSQANNLFTLQTLERERATLLKHLADPNLSVAHRQQKTHSVYRRMVDAERMVLRDDRIAADNSVLANKAFANYQLTFLVHASAESGQSVMNHWLDTLNLSHDDILNSKVGFK